MHMHIHRHIIYLMFINSPIGLLTTFYGTTMASQYLFLHSSSIVLQVSVLSLGGTISAVSSIGDSTPPPPPRDTVKHDRFERHLLGDYNYKIKAHIESVSF